MADPTILPTDDDGHPIPVLRLEPDGAHAIDVTDTSAANETAFADGVRVIIVYATGDCHIRLGDADVEAADTDHFLPAGDARFLALGHRKQPRTSWATHIAAIRASVDCTLYVSECI